MFNPDLLNQAVAKVYGQKPHPDVPEIKIKDYAVFARAAARMFQEAQPKPEHVKTAYHSLTNANVSPAEFERIWDVAKPLANRLLDRDPNIHDLMLLHGQHPSQIQAYYMDHPHPKFPMATAGDISRYANVALYPARVLAGRDPNLHELGSFALRGYQMEDIVAHYSDDGSLSKSKVAQ